MSWLIWFMPSSTRSSCSGQDKGMTAVEWTLLTIWQKYESWAAEAVWELRWVAIECITALTGRKWCKRGLEMSLLLDGFTCIALLHWDSNAPWIFTPETPTGAGSCETVMNLVSMSFSICLRWQSQIPNWFEIIRECVFGIVSCVTELFCPERFHLTQSEGVPCTMGTASKETKESYVATLS